MTIFPSNDDPVVYPASCGQEAMWVQSQLNSANYYNLLWQIDFSGPLDPKRLTEALQSMVQRHEQLRCRFRVHDAQLMQVVFPAFRVECPLEDLSALPDDERAARVHDLSQEVGQLPFDIENPPLIRFCLIRLDRQEHSLLVCFHHLITDGSSWPVFFKELSAFYAGQSLAPLPCSYGEFAAAQKQLREGAAWQGHREHWISHLKGSAPPLDVPLAKPLPVDRHSMGGVREEVFPASIKDGLKALADRNRSTLFRVLLAGFALLLHRLTGETDVVTSTILTGRPRSELKGLIGLFINPTPLRTLFEDDLTFVEVLRAVHRELDGAVGHEEYPFHLIAGDIRPARNLSHESPIKTAFVKIPASIGADIGDLRLREKRFYPRLSQRNLTLYAQEIPEGIRMVCEYGSERFDAAAIRGFFGHFRTLLEGIAAGPEIPVDSLPLLTPTERHRLLVEWNDTARAYPLETCVHRLFEEQAARSPDSVAVVCGDGFLLYRELDLRANRLAHHLAKRGVGPEVPVGLCVERSLDMAVALLGILKAGGAYVPIAPDTPCDRSRFMLADTKAPVLVTQRGLREKFSSCPLEIVCLDTDRPEIAREPETPCRSNATGRNLAYVIYTSGSTGQPKGVGVCHGSVVNHNLYVSEAFGLQSRDKVLQFASLAFDAAVEEIFPTWISGGCLVLPGTFALMAAEDFSEFVERNGVTVLNLPTAYWYELTLRLLESSRPLPASVRVVIVGGEKASSRQLDAWLSLTGGTRTWINTYGPTETTIISTLHLLNADAPAESAASDPPIGRPIANTTAYILDRKLQPVPAGVTGELYLGGAGVARGYINLPDLTRETFVGDPFCGDPERRMYRTGDLARYGADGTIEYQGRIDRQVKIRGFRIEPGEIENALQKHPAVREAVVLAREDRPGTKRLVAYVTPLGRISPTPAEFGAFLRKSLPEYMLPCTYVALDRFPLTPNGKVDRLALPPPEGSIEPAKGHVAPRTEVERTLAEIWSDILHREHIGVNDGFFELGGHSLLATRVVSRINLKLNVRLPLRGFFEARTLADVAAYLEGVLWQRAAEATPSKPGSDFEEGEI